MGFDTGDLVTPIQAALEGAASSLYESGREVAEEDKEFFKEQAQLLADLTKDLANVESEEDRATVLDAMEQQVTTVELRVARRRFQLSQEAAEQMKQVMKIATETVVGFLRKIVLG